MSKNYVVCGELRILASAISDLTGPYNSLRVGSLLGERVVLRVTDFITRADQLIETTPAIDAAVELAVAAHKRLGYARGAFAESQKINSILDYADCADELKLAEDAINDLPPLARRLMLISDVV